MTEITVACSQTIVINKTVPWQRVLAGIAVDAQVASIEEFLAEDPLPTREPTPAIIVLETINDIEAARRVREKKAYQRVYLCDGYNKDLTVFEADRRPREIETGIYKWSMPALPVTINGWAGASILHIVAKYMCAEHPHCVYPYQFCEDFIDELTVDDAAAESNIAALFFDDITCYEEKICLAAARGEGRRLERIRAAKSLLDSATKETSPDAESRSDLAAPVSVVSTLYDEEVAKLAAQQQIKVTFEKK